MFQPYDQPEDPAIRWVLAPLQSLEARGRQPELTTIEFSFLHPFFWFEPSVARFGPIYHQVLPATKRIESFTEARVRTNASAIQFASTVFQTSKIEANADSNLPGSG